MTIEHKNQGGARKGEGRKQGIELSHIILC